MELGADEYKLRGTPEALPGNLAEAEAPHNLETQNAQSVAKLVETLTLERVVGGLLALAPKPIA